MESAKLVFRDQSPRILIARLSAIGDCILTLPLACALRDVCPHAYIAWAAENAGAKLLDGHPALDEVIRVPKRVLRSPAGVWNLRGQLRRRQFDITLDPQGLSKSAAIAWLSGAPRRIGFQRPVGREISPWLNTELIHGGQAHVVDRYRQLLSPFATSLPPVRFDLPSDATTREKVATFLAAADFSAGFLVINPGAGWDSKLWPAERFAEVARQLGLAADLPSLVVWAGEREAAWARQIVAGSGGWARLAPPTTLPELAEVVRQARLFIGSDTGPMHLAAAVGTRCVGLFGTTQPAECGPYGAFHLAIQSYYQGGSCRTRRTAPNLAMQAITIEAVVAGALQVLGLPRVLNSRVA